MRISSNQEPYRQLIDYGYMILEYALVLQEATLRI